jgi:hypothetical protein
MKKIRFGDLVRQSGRPTTIELWTPPEKNKELQRAIRANRVLTVQHRNVGNKRDVGEIGFRKQREAFYLIFPRALPTASPDPVIGINYDLLEPPTLLKSSDGKVSKPAAPVSKSVAFAPKKSAPPPPPKKYRFTVRVSIEADVEVTAKSAKEARVLALEAVQHKPLSSSDWRRGSVRVLLGN